MRKLLQWCNDHILKLGVLFLIFFIPLYPKLPLIDIVQTWVYIRLEDVFVAILVLVFLIQSVATRLKNFRTPLTAPIIIFWGVGALSTVVSLTVIGPTLIEYYPHLAILHYVRRIEYLIVFFIAASTIRSIKDISHYLVAIAGSVVGVVAYGFAQKFLGAPAFLTMNEEFAKGLPLYLSATSRITSTFAGHYDLAAYLVFIIALLGSVVFGIRNVFGKVALLAIVVLAYILLLFTASRVSFVVYLVAISTMLWMHKRRLLIIPVIIISVILLQNVSGASERFSKTFRLRQVIYDVDSGKPVAIVTVGEGGQLIAEIPKSAAEEDLPIGSGFISVPAPGPAPATSTPGPPATVATSPLPPEEELRIALEKKQLFSFREGEKLTTGFGDVATISGSFLIQKALVYDISFTTRVQGQWPKAVRAFQRNMVLGSGYSTLSIAADSSYMRALGETGIAGFASFFFIFISLLLYTNKALPSAGPLVRSFAIGSVAGLVGLLLNAILIDVFEASKVAYTMWMTFGIAVGSLTLHFKERFSLWEETKKLAQTPMVFIVILFVLIVVLFARTMTAYFVADDFTWLRWAAESYTRDIPTYFNDAKGFFYRPLSKLYFFIGFAVFWLKPFGYHAVNVLLHFGSTALTYLLARKISRSNLVAVLASVYFAVLGVHHENVIWISGISSLLGSFFALLALYVFTFSVARVRWKVLWFVLSVVFLTLSLLSYEGMAATPAILVAYVLFYGGKQEKRYSFLLLALIPLYTWLRGYVHALMPSGDYGVNVFKLPVNGIGNSIGYVTITVFGPWFIPVNEALRQFIRGHLTIGASFAIGILLIGIGYWRGSHPGIRLPRSVAFWIVFILLAMTPYLGLGNIAERYAYLPSVGLSILFVELLMVVRSVSHPRVKLYVTLAIVALFTGSLIGNFQQLQSISQNWIDAGKISSKVLLTVRKRFFPLASNTTLIYANVPTRLGRAWVFPVGFDDAHWHIFRDASLKVDVHATAEEAITALSKLGPGPSWALIIEDDNVKEIYK